MQMRCGNMPVPKKRKQASLNFCRLQAQQQWGGEDVLSMTLLSGERWMLRSVKMASPQAWRP